MDPVSSMTFPALAVVPHRFVLRQPGLAMDVDRQQALELLAPWHTAAVREMGYDEASLRTAEQVHGSLVVRVDRNSGQIALAADGLVTNDPDVLLGIYVADCGAIFLHDARQRCVGLVHSGKKGSELGIVREAIMAMKREFGSDAADMFVQLSPCIRPPHYEVDFASAIREQCLQEGVRPENYHDCGLCTAQDTARFYSYRVEKGRTGRMLALLGLRGS